MIAVEIKGRRWSLCQVRNRLSQTGGGGGGSIGHRPLLATSFPCWKQELIYLKLLNKKLSWIKVIIGRNNSFDGMYQLEYFEKL